ncbi:MAG TPA: MYXO-CTERM sorting domain-containing protein, partial [Polyangiales bacterium]|nr:MYXO-CTERM sorting domain-containing protein [Polyangiales bacterium]
GLPISPGAKPTNGIVGSIRQPANPTTPLVAATTQSTPQTSAGTPDASGEGKPTPGNEGGLCSAAPAQRGSSVFALGLFSAVFAFAARRRRGPA